MNVGKIGKKKKKNKNNDETDDAKLELHEFLTFSSTVCLVIASVIRIVVNGTNHWARTLKVDA